eukprot:GHVN01091647.1.p1 GENE.GHVN01091647.1~~GHVN01091647.1.p1  ORF type:complete len:108 (-),score=3.79 GHVN01091647.1:51-374(-)
MVLLMTEPKKCLRHGCHQTYHESENHETACTYHSGQPIFRDLAKTWSCCSQTSWEWDDFVKLKGCTTARHSDEKPKRPTEALLSPSPMPIKSIDSFNQVCEVQSEVE